ncbi:hypothetical protein [Lutibacter maritimus]|uniref:Uncharacterized protein n=1 Tax=Lutibacter maritimus TaxID=593133 RepID=A0A1I6RJD5_9FLAO|nr:hypothetical protein [Lutibacter maritimus]SFS64785.1 hypothetical protein SAMN04488006_2531 [Lutibacter maritimus]
MKKLLKNTILIIGTFILFSSLLSNTAQPGIWNAGGSGSFQLLYPEDSIAYKKIQMQSESIHIQLYKGFAVVKGVYNFLNTTNDSLTIKVGYPINTVFPSKNYQSHLNQVVFDDLYKIKGSIHQQEIPLLKLPSNNSNWYVWEITFPPKQLLNFTVHFIVNTNNAQILQGYNKENKNGFIYLIETGSIWKSPIETGNFYAQLKDDINLADIKGIAPSQLYFNPSNNTLHLKLANYGVQPDDNFILIYNKKIDDFNFEEIIAKSNYLFQEIDVFSNNKPSVGYTKISLKNPYEVKGAGNFIITGIYYFIFFGIPILVGIILILIIYKLLKRRRKSDY